MISPATLRRIYRLRDGREVLVEPPSVGTAVTLLEVMEAAQEEADEDLVFEALIDWLDPEVVEDFAACSGRGRVQRITALLMQGHEGTRAEKASGGGAEPKPASWRLLISRYASLYGADPWSVWTSTPFPFFLSMSDEAAAERARTILDDALSAGIPHAGKAGSAVLARLRATAEGAPAASRLQQLVNASPEQVRADEAALEAEMARLYGARNRDLNA